MEEMYQFLLNCWILGKIDEDYLDAMVKKGFITSEERDLIVATPKL